MASYRLQRIASRIKFLVGTVIQREIGDPRIGLVTVLKVDVAPDLTEAAVYISIFGKPGDRSKALHALEDARGYIQQKVGKSLETRNTPRLRFILDESQDKVSRIEALMVEAKEEQEDAMAKKPGKKDDKETKASSSKSAKPARKPAATEKKGGSKAPPAKGSGEKNVKAGKPLPKPASDAVEKKPRRFRDEEEESGGPPEETGEAADEEKEEFLEEEFDEEDEDFDEEFDEDEEDEDEDEDGEEEDENYREDDDY